MIKMEKTAREIIKYPLLSEKAMDAIDIENKLIFIVDSKATKKQIKEAIEELYDIEVENVNTLNTFKSQKKAMIKLKPEYSAMDLATDLQLI